ncbi:MAG: hypothetical protein AAF081_17945, partial [Actinomycetota bacterium]
VAALDPVELSGNALSAGAWAVSRVGSAPLASAFLARLADEPAMLLAGDVPLGPRALAEGPLLAAAGDLRGAADRLRDAIEAGDRRAPLWGALARTELARVLRCRAAVDAASDDDLHASIRRLEQSALLFFRAGGYAALASRLEPDPQPAVDLIGSPMVGVLVAGDWWTVGFGVMAPVEVPASKGLLALRHLVRSPGRPTPVSALDRIADGAEAALVLSPSDQAAVEALRPDDATRSRVGKLLGRTRDRLAEIHPLLGAHLRATLTLGDLPRYDPPADPAVWWRTEP